MRTPPAPAGLEVRMRSQLTMKLVALFVLGLLFFIPQVVIGLIGNERRHYRDEAVADIARSNAGEQCVTGPIVVLPYRVRHVTQERDAASGRTIDRERFSDEQIVLLPESLDVRSRLNLESRARGIYSTRLFRTSVALTGSFQVPILPKPDDGTIVSWGEARLLMGVSDPRGMREAPSVSWRDAAIACESGTARAWVGPGFSAPLGVITPGESPQAAPFAVTLPLVGTQAFRVAPVGRSTVVRLESSWPHPSFDGKFLPDERSVTSKGFSATWRLSRFATGVEDLVAAQAARTEPAEPARTGRGDNYAVGAGTFEPVIFGVQFLDPVDAYRLTERALKYGILFILLTFVAFFLMEVLGEISVHPMQYGLVAGALTLFFLLLLSLSEHLPYLGAYLLAGGACVALITAYVRHVLRSVPRAQAFGGGLALLYALLYVVMISQDYALLLGSVLLFAVLGYVMMATRRVDWSRVGERKPS